MGGTGLVQGQRQLLQSFGQPLADQFDRLLEGQREVVTGFGLGRRREDRLGQAL